MIQESVKMLEENVIDFGVASEKLLSKFGKVRCEKNKVETSKALLHRKTGMPTGLWPSPI